MEEHICIVVEQALRVQRLVTPTNPRKLAKLLDPLLFSNSKDPTFENWRIQINGKFEINVDHFVSI